MLQYCKTLACKITALTDSLFSDDKLIVNEMLMTVEREWLNIIKLRLDDRPSVSCLLIFSKQKKTLQSEHEALWIKEVELMKAVLEHLKAYRDWDDWVNYVSYELIKARLKSCLKHFLNCKTKNNTQRAKWIKAWLFVKQSTQIKMRQYTSSSHNLHPQMQFWKDTVRLSKLKIKRHYIQ